MRASKILLAILLIMFLQSGCSSTSDSEGETTADATSSESGLDDIDAPEDSSSAETAAEETPDASSEDQALEDSLVENETPPPETLEDPTQLGDAEQTPVAPAPTEEVAPPPAEVSEAPMNEAPVTITGLDFKGSDNGGTIVIKTSSPTNYTTRSEPEKNQFIVEIQNAILPKKFQRPYNTKEFSSAIGLINGYQNPGSTIARIVVQLREPIEPSVQQEGDSILVMALGSATPVAEVTPLPAEETTAPEIESEASVSGFDERILQGKTLDQFLLGPMKFYGRKISLQIKEGDLRDVFYFISEESGMNLILSDDVTGRVSFKLKEIPWDQALIVLLQTRQLGYIRQGNILRIASLKTIRAETDATKDMIESQKSLQPLKVKVFPVNYAQAKDLEPQVLGFLTARGKVKSDARTNTIIVNDIGDVISKVGKLLAALDTQTPQVLIEGKIVEARESFSQEIGVNWGSSPRGPAKVGGIGTENYATLNTPASHTALTIGPLVGKLFNWDNVSAQLQLYESESKIKVLSSPRIVTLNNIKATIEQTTEKPVPVSTTVAGATTVSVSYKTAKLSLGVTPQITAEGGVVLNVNVIREFFGEEVISGTSATPLNGRSASTTVLVNNGETAVIGGIYQNDATETETGIPYLRKIPIIGGLFKSQRQESQKNELLIFLSPRVLNTDKAFGSPSQPAAQTVEPEPEFESETL